MLQKNMKINDINIAYTDSGSGIPIIFHHGYTNSKKVWTDLVPHINKKYRSITFDARGCGETDRPDNGFTLDGYVKDIIAIADELKFSKFHYVGHSMGGLIGMWLTHKYPERVNKAILIAPAPSVGVRDGLLFEDMMKRNRRIRRDQDIDLLVKERMKMSTVAITEEQARERSFDFLDVSDEHFEQSGTMIANANIRKELQAATNEIMFIVGAADFLLKDNLEDFLSLQNGSIHVFSRIGHSIPREIPEECATVINDFLEYGVVNYKTLNQREDSE